MLAFALRRGTRLRQRRRVVRSAAVVAVLVSVGVPVLLASADPSQEGSHVRVADTVVPTSVPDASDAAPSQLASGSAPASGAVTSSHVAAPARRAAKSVPTTAPTATAVPPIPVCKPSEVDMRIATDKDTYLAVDIVHVAAHISNESSHVCVLPPGTTFTVFDSSGRRVATDTAFTEYADDATWGPGDDLDAAFDWDQRCPESAGCTAAGVATRGAYRVEAVWSTGVADYGPTSAAFTLS
jgi:hypothetical protein